jgi:hypothetical protein
MRDPAGVLQAMSSLGMYKRHPLYLSDLHAGQVTRASLRACDSLLLGEQEKMSKLCRL